ncbi:hypothetical protein [Sphingomonas bacterium]|uniref:hypothetical protein n=1 Tax=Sphingomonas bacterium TaxID=1895847 RepID=UPI0015759C7F|nr:hypothetical protein [Sphingomonas bacterium]
MAAFAIPSLLPRHDAANDGHQRLNVDLLVQSQQEQNNGERQPDTALRSGPEEGGGTRASRSDGIPSVPRAQQRR